MSSPFVTVVADLKDPRTWVVGVQEEATEWSEDFMTPLDTRIIGIVIVKIAGEEVAFFATFDYGVWYCQRQCENAPEIAEQLNNMGFSAHVIW